MTFASAITIEGLTKRYRSTVAVDELTVDIPRGVVAGFIGPNGAGKTTTMAMLLGLVRPTAGTAHVLGEPLDRPGAYLPRVGALIEGPAMWPALSGAENLRLLARLGGHDELDVGGLLELVGLADRGGDRFGTYSLGMKQRLGIAAALLGDPELLVLDEPANGLDPVGMSEMRELIAELASGDRTVLVSSHLLSELEHVCDWLLVIDRGRLVYAGGADGFRGRAATQVVLAPVDLTSLLALADVVARLGFDAGRDGDQLVVAAGDSEARQLAASLNQASAAAGIVLAELHVRRPTLESHYLSLVKDAKGEDR